MATKRKNSSSINGNRFIADQPIYESAIEGNYSAREDGLDFANYAEILADFARSTNGPFTIGIHGSWGHGKTSLLRTIEKELTKNKSQHLFRIFKYKTEDELVIPVRFNAWQFESEPNPLIPLVLSIKSALDIATRKKFGPQKTIRQLRRVLKGIAAGALASTELKIDGKILGATIKPSSFFPAYRDQAPTSLQMTTLLAQKTNYYQAFQLLNDVCSQLKGKAKIVLFIDDLDRCEPEKSLQILENVKLLLWQPGFIFFLAVDSLQLEHYINTQYHIKKNSDLLIDELSALDEEWGRKYFEKLIQVSFHIPQHNDRYNGFTEQLYRLTNWPVKQAAAIKPLLGAPLAYNPRRTIKVLNTILLIEKLLPKWFNRDIRIVAVEIILTIRYSRNIYQSLCGNSAEENEKIRLTLKEWSEIKDFTLADPPVKRPTSYDSQLRELWQAIKRDESLRSVLFSEPGQLWLTLEENQRRVVARLIEDQKIEENFTSDDESFTAKGNEAFNNGDYIAAFGFYCDAVENNPQNVEAQIGLEKTEHMLNQTTTDNGDKSRKIFEKRFRGLWDIVHRSMSDGRFDRAERSLNMLLKIDPSNAAAHNRLGILYAKLNKYDIAAERFNNAIKLEPGASGFHNLGLTYYEMGDYSQALSSFSRALDYEDNLAARHIAIAKTHEKLGNEKAMLEALIRATELESNVDTLTLLMQAYDATGLKREANLIRKQLEISNRRSNGLKVA